jgi:poly-gamma-glutamate capsule biosynthesis protein CapA/YwtB (metallophosphatase superfamily)
VAVRAGGAAVAMVAASDRRSRAPMRPGRLAIHRPERLGAAVAAQVRGLRERGAADVVVVSLHTGVEHALTPQPATVALARALIDAGADLVLCHHTHTAQPVELWGDGAIAYGLGELLFDAAPSATRHAALFTFALARRPGGRYRVDGVDIAALGPAPAKVTRAFLAGLAARSAQRGTPFEPTAGGLRWRR